MLGFSSLELEMLVVIMQKKNVRGHRIKISKITWKLTATFLHKWPPKGGNKKKRGLKKNVA